MKLLYTSDLHGNRGLYLRLFSFAEKQEVNGIVVGGDLSPRKKGSIQENVDFQREFYEQFLIPAGEKFKQGNKGREVYLIMGNDDYRINSVVLKAADNKKQLALIHNRALQVSADYWMCGYSFVNTTPFRLKDWEKPDTADGIFPPQLFEEEFRTVPKEAGTIADDMAQIARLSNPKKTIYVIHAPPFNTNLDVISSKNHVGSKALRQFIEMQQPPLTLHGHIHESPQMSGFWKDTIGKTICINVGSRYPKDVLNCVIIDTEMISGIRYYEL